MPTTAQNIARTTAHCDAIKNGPSTLEEQNILAEAIYALDPASYAALSNAEKAAIIPRYFRQMALNAVDQYEAMKARTGITPATQKLPEVP